jgi:hypothetical protein
VRKSYLQSPSSGPASWSGSSVQISPLPPDTPSLCNNGRRMRPDIVSTLVLAVVAVALPIVASLTWPGLRNGVQRYPE